jgi:protein-tyrosine-phosphatase
MSAKPTATAIARLRNACQRAETAEGGTAMTLCFVCFGNIIRSQAAEVFARRWLTTHPIITGLRVASASVSPASACGEPVDPRMTAHCAERGAPLTGRSRRLCPADTTAIIAVMTEELAIPAARLLGRTADDLLRFGDYVPELAGADIPDPYHQPDRFAEVADLLYSGVEQILPIIAAHLPPADPQPSRDREEASDTTS